MLISKNLFAKCFPHAKPSDVEKYFPFVQKGLDQYKINTPRRIAAFFAQIAHESASLHYSQEIASGAAYEGREDLGNTVPGDGVKFKGRGLIQITGRNNYTAISIPFYTNFTEHPEKLEQPEFAFLSACWFWDVKNLNRFADVDGFENITRRINGGLNGIEERKSRWEETRKALNIQL